MEEENIIVKKDATDRISELPECIIENILLRLYKPQDLVRVSVLSKKWFALTASLPVLKFIFNTPNLLIFKYVNAWDYFTLKSDSGELKTCMECHIIDKVDTLWLLKLRQFLEKADRFKTLSLINLYERFSVDFELLKGTQLPPYELEHVEIKMPIRDMLPVLDGLLWCFRPRSLSLTSFFSETSDEEQSHFLKFISEKLIQQEDQGPTNIRIEWFFPSEAGPYFSQSALFTSLPTVTFKKEEGPDTDQGQKWRKKYQRRRFKQVQGSLG